MLIETDGVSLNRRKRERVRESVELGLLYWRKKREERREEGGGRCAAKRLQKQKPLTLTFTHTLLWREEGTGSGSLCLRTPEERKKEK